jgi:predicted metal-dependent phosphoesterase TrpH
MKVELHCHSHHSRGTKITFEGLDSPRDIVRHAKRIGLGAVALTDHDKSDGWREASREARRKGIVFVPGIEIDTQSGHVLGLGLNEYIEGGMPVDETVESIHEQGGIAVAAHPFDIRSCGIKHEINKVDAVEVFNALSLDRISNVFTEKKARESGIPMVSGSDAHTLDMLGTASIDADFYDMNSLLKGIAKGKVSFTKNYVPLKSIINWSRKRFELSYNDVIHYMHENYGRPKEWVARKMLDQFMNSKRENFWRGVAIVSTGATMMYGSIKVLSYY